MSGRVASLGEPWWSAVRVDDPEGNLFCVIQKDG
jgi:hypothetical protein